MTRNRHLRRACTSLVVLMTVSSYAAAQGRGGGGAPPSIEERTSGMRKLDGYFPLYWDERAGTLLPRDSALRHRLPLLDRAVGRTRLERHRARSRRRRAGTRRHVPSRRSEGHARPAQPDRSARAARIRASEKSVEDSFAKSILWGFTVAAESNGRVLVDATPFFLRDIHGAGGSLRPGNVARRSQREARSISRTRATFRRTLKST